MIINIFLDENKIDSVVKVCDYNTPIGKIRLTDNGEAITSLAFVGVNDDNAVVLNETPLIHRAFCQLDEYFRGVRRNFDLPLCPHGTEFQKKVWQALLKIPYGEVCSYIDIANEIGSAKAFRAVGGANNKNPIPIIIPCHRVIGKNGKLVGYAGGLEIKKFLLEIESKAGKL